MSDSKCVMASCNVRSCSTAFRFAGGVTTKASNDLPFLKYLRQSMRTAIHTKIDGRRYWIHPLYSEWCEKHYGQIKGRTKW